MKERVRRTGSGGKVQGGVWVGSRNWGNGLGRRVEESVEGGVRVWLVERVKAEGCGGGHSQMTMTMTIFYLVPLNLQNILTLYYIKLKLILGTTD